MHLSDFDYRLPDGLIAQEPLPDRDASRMLVVDRRKGTISDHLFRELPSFLHPGDCLVLNDSRVFPARLFGSREGYHRQVEVFLLQPVSADRTEWSCLVRPGRKMHPGAHVAFSDCLWCEVLSVGERGERTVRFHCTGDLDRKIEAVGHVPLPPYIHRPDSPPDRERYQTVYARERGSAAAPTAGLHFTEQSLAACAAAGAAIARVTLHVGLGTFQPLQDVHFAEHRLHSEHYEVGEDAASKIAAATRVVAVGTTAVRTLETSARLHGRVQAGRGETSLFLYPGDNFRATGAMLTNFHLPKSSLLLLVCAFGGVDLILKAYRHAVAERYRFFSYGDCMLIL